MKISRLRNIALGAVDVWLVTAVLILVSGEALFLSLLAGLGLAAIALTAGCLLFNVPEYEEEKNA